MDLAIGQAGGCSHVWSIDYMTWWDDGSRVGQGALSWCGEGCNGSEGLFEREKSEKVLNSDNYFGKIRQNQSKTL